MKVQLGRIVFEISVGKPLVTLEVCRGLAIVEVGSGAGFGFNATLHLQGHAEDAGRLDWQWRRGVVRHCQLWGAWTGSRFWTDDDLAAAPDGRAA